MMPPKAYGGPLMPQPDIRGSGMYETSRTHGVYIIVHTAS